MRISAPTSVLALLSSFVLACASGEAAPQTPQTTATVDLDGKKPEAELSAVEAAREEAKNAGILSLLKPEEGGGAGVFGSGGFERPDNADVWGGLTGTEVGEAYGVGGLGLVGTGRGGGGTGEGTIGLGSIGTIGRGGGGGSGQGYGTGSGRLGGSKRTTSKVTAAGTVVTGALPKELIVRVVRLSHNRLRHCYEQGLQKDPTLAGKVTTKFTISPKGAVSAAKSEGSLSDASVVSCVEKTFLSMVFPEPDKGGVVVVSYPVVFAPGEDASSASGAAASAPAATEPRIAGKPLAEVGIADLEKAMKDLGMTNITRAEHPSIKGASVLSASKGKQQYTITFVPSSAGIKSLPSEEKRRMDSGAGIEKDGSALVIAGPDQASSKALLDDLTTRK